MKVGDVIRDARIARGWSQAKLAREVSLAMKADRRLDPKKRQSISRTAVGQWENGETAPNRFNAPYVAKALELPLGAILPIQNIVPVDRTTYGRMIPILPWEGFMQRAEYADPPMLFVEDDYPDDAVAMRVIDDSMQNEIMAGEIIVVSESTSPRSGDYVIAQMNDGPHILRRLNDRGLDPSGNRVFDLLSPNNQYPTLPSSSANNDKVLATVVGHFKRLRRP